MSPRGARTAARVEMFAATVKEADVAGFVGQSDAVCLGVVRGDAPCLAELQIDAMWGVELSA